MCGKQYYKQCDNCELPHQVWNTITGYCPNPNVKDTVYRLD